MTCDQFCQVVLLPQGQFADFLRADAEARRPLLEQLFGTDRFSRAEQVLAERRRSAWRAVEDAEVEGEAEVVSDRADAAVTRGSGMTLLAPATARPLSHPPLPRRPRQKRHNP